MKLMLKKRIETTLFKRICDENSYIIFSSGSQRYNYFKFNSYTYNILNYSLEHSLQDFLSHPLVNNFLEASFFSSRSDFNLFFKNFKADANFIFFIKFKNLYIFNFDSKFKLKFDNININAYVFTLRLQKLFLNWLPLGKNSFCKFK
jgi:hypothetical protein